MKKFIALILGVLTVFGLAATAFAIHAEIPAETQAVVARGATQIFLSGNIRVRGWYLNDINTSTRQPDDFGSSSYYDQRVRLALDAAMGGVSGKIHLESNGGTKDTWTWGTGSFDSKPADMNILEAWIQWKGEGLGFPAGIKIGHMPLTLGAVPLFFDHTKFGDDAILLFGDPTPNTHAAVGTIKAIENDLGGPLGNADDADVYFALINHKISGHTLGIYAAHVNQSDAGGVPVETSFTDVGVHATGTVAGLGYTGQVDFNMGDIDADTDAEGWAAWLALSYKLDPVTLRLMGAYGSGDDDPLDSDVETFINFLGANRYYTVVYDYQIAGASGSRYKGISNTTVVNLGVDLKPTDKLSLALDGYWLQATETPSGVDDDLGWEFDLKGTYSIAKNLKYFVWAGYLSAGDFYEDTTGSDENPSVVMHGLELAF